MKLDPYKHKERYLAWKEKVSKQGIPNISKINSKIILNYIIDMELGLNVAISSKKGSRSYNRLNSLVIRIVQLVRKFEESHNILDITKLTEREIHTLFSGMRDGLIKRLDGKPYKAPADYVKSFKAFWHWHQKVSRKEGLEVRDITVDLDTTKEKPKWVYLDEEQVKKLTENARYDYKVLIMFLFDSGLRAPTELMNIKVSDFLNDFSELVVRDEISKTFGRRIKLMLCSSMIKEYVAEKKLSKEDYLFTMNQFTVNKYLKRLAKRLFGDGVSLAGQKYSEITMYDLRHCSCCYWLPRYKSESALKFRFGWKKSDKIHYYSEMLGMRDTIKEEDMLVDVTKTEIEQRLLKTENEKKVLEERMRALEETMKKILDGLDNGLKVVNSAR